MHVVCFLCTGKVSKESIQSLIFRVAAQMWGIICHIETAARRHHVSQGTVRGVLVASLLDLLLEEQSHNSLFVSATDKRASCASTRRVKKNTRPSFFGLKRKYLLQGPLISFERDPNRRFISSYLLDTFSVHLVQSQPKSKRPFILIPKGYSHLQPWITPSQPSV